MKNSEKLILEKIEANRKLIEEMNSKIENLIEMNNPKKKKKNNPKERTVYELDKELELETRKEKTIEDLIADLEKDKEKEKEPKPKVITPLPSN